MKQYILTPELKGDLYWAKIPQGILNIHVCYVTDSDKLPQRINYNTRLELGHDFQIRNGFIVSRRIEVLKNSFILIQLESSDVKKCKTCRQESRSGSFCSHCGAFLF